MKRKVCFFFSLSNPILFRCKMAQKVRDIHMKLKDINEEAGRFGLQSQVASSNVPQVPHPVADTINRQRQTDSISMDSIFRGREQEISNIVELLMTSSDDAISVVPIEGMGGIGKTTLAQNIFNDQRIQGQFERRIWTRVSEDFEVTRLLDLIIESLTRKRPEADSREAKVKKLQEELEGKRYLLVLDDVWSDNSTVWNEFLRSLKAMNKAKGNFILVTTRLQEVASMVATSTFLLRELSDENCWLILKERAFGGKEVPVELQGIGFEIAKKCKGLPLLANVLGGTLGNKGRDAWISLLQNELPNSSRDEDAYVRQILKVSFDHLPTPACKNCFAYCCIFPKDYWIKRKELIQLWMAQGFLQTNPGINVEMEETGDRIFNILLQNNLLQEPETNDLGNIFGCKMHDYVHDLAQSISSSKTINMTQNRRRDFDEVRHVSLGTCGEEIHRFPNEKAGYVRTLFLENYISDDVFAQFTSLRVLKLSSSNLEELSESIGKLTKLRYLDLSNTKIKALPQSLCKLYCLQTFRAMWISFLGNFPDNFKNLKHLRHFGYYSFGTSSTLMPIEIGYLSNLRTLPFFNVGEEKGRQIDELQDLNNLSGRLEIRNLELVKDKSGAEFAHLFEKQNISDLELCWGNNRAGDNNDSDVLEGLHPHPNLKALKINDFLGNQLASWIMKLENLVRIELRLCRRCKEIPALGRLPFLQKLSIQGLDEITCMGTSLYGFDKSGGSSNYSGVDQVATVVFPKLKYLLLEDMPKLVEWMEATVASTTGHRVLAFPVLEKLIIRGCPQLTTAPSHFPGLEELWILSLHDGSTVISQICSKATALRTLEITDVKKLACLPDMLVQTNRNLKELELRSCPDLMQLPHDLHSLRSFNSLYLKKCPNLLCIPIPSGREERLTSLQTLIISHCDELTHLPSEMFESSNKSMKYLSVNNCSNLVSFPMDFRQTQMPSLQMFKLYRCPKLSSMPKGISCLASLRKLSIGPSSDMELDSFRDALGSLGNRLLSSLESLGLWGRRHWDSVPAPDQFQNLSSLERLVLHDFGIETLPEWVGNLSSISRIGLDNCENLKHLPSVGRLTKLECLYVDNCPLLKERCNQQSGPNSEWLNISHIPLIKIDGVRIKDEN